MSTTWGTRNPTTITANPPGPIAGNCLAEGGGDLARTVEHDVLGYSVVRLIGAGAAVRRYVEAGRTVAAEQDHAAFHLGLPINRLMREVRTTNPPWHTYIRSSGVMFQDMGGGPASGCRWRSGVRVHALLRGGRGAGASSG